ncbi:hypothetical protein MUP05_06760 [Candidatus Bathyarchaeota archaeon]|nr:hypothetical protein [Candidatus Bathyarchaeota archaeon]
MGQETSVLFRDVVRQILEIQVPLSLFPLLTWLVGGPIVCSKSDSSRVRLKAVLLSVIGFCGLFWLHLMPWLYLRGDLQLADKSLRDLIALTIAIKEAIAKLTGDSVVWALSFEIASLGVVASFTGTEQKWVKDLTKVLWVAFIVLAILAIAIPIAVQ